MGSEALGSGLFGDGAGVDGVSEIHCSGGGQSVRMGIWNESASASDHAERSGPSILNGVDGGGVVTSRLSASAGSCVVWWCRLRHRGGGDDAPRPDHRPCCFEICAYACGVSVTVLESLLFLG